MVADQSGHPLSYIEEYSPTVRADRLVAIVLLLQVHGRLTAAQIAEHLETSTRTVRRDLDALCVAGVPVYPQRGRGGGWVLLGGHRIDLSGLTADEAQTLLLATDSASATLGPGFGEGLAAARRKLIAALPEPLRDSVEAARGSVLVDRTRWGPGASDPAPAGAADERTGDPSHLNALRRAVLSGHQVVVGYEPPGRPVEQRRLHPHGLVCKQGVWYLVATAPAGLRTYRLSRVRSVEVTDQPVSEPPGFDLGQAWSGIQQRLSARAAAALVVESAIDPSALRRLRATVGRWWPVEEVGADRGGRVRVLIRFPDARLAAIELVPFTSYLEVISPDPVRDELAAMGRTLVESYARP